MKAEAFGNLGNLGQGGGGVKKERRPQRVASMLAASGAPAFQYICLKVWLSACGSKVCN